MTRSVYIDRDKCCGCTVCLQKCPTEAIRVERSRAVILADRCIDCGACVSVCPHHAVTVESDDLDALKKYQYNVILVDTVLYGQFENLTDPNIVLEGLLKIGFDDVFEVGAAAEMLSLYYQNPDAPIWKGVYPRISTDCPVTVNLIRLEYPELTQNLVPAVTTFELAAILARRQAAEKTGLDPAQIGVGYVSPCPARNTRVHHPVGLAEPVIDYVLSMRDVYVRLLGPMKTVAEPRPLSRVGRLGLNWSRAGGQSANLHPKSCLSVDDAANVRTVLDYVEDGKLLDADYIEALPCVQGCFGGCLTVENPFNAKLKMRRIIDPIPQKMNDMPPDMETLSPWTAPVEPEENHTEDFAKALQRQAKALEYLRGLPGFDCGSCGAPSCRAFADDVARGWAPVDDCIYNLIGKIRGKTDHLAESDEFLPPTYRKPLPEAAERKES